MVDVPECEAYDSLLVVIGVLRLAGETEQADDLWNAYWPEHARYEARLEEIGGFTHKVHVRPVVETQEHTRCGLPGKMKLYSVEAVDCPNPCRALIWAEDSDRALEYAEEVGITDGTLIVGTVFDPEEGVPTSPTLVEFS